MVISASEARSQLFPLIETMYLLRTATDRGRFAKSKAEILSGDLYEYQLPITKVSQGKKHSLPLKKKANTKKRAISKPKTRS